MPKRKFMNLYFKSKFYNIFYELIPAIISFLKWQSINRCCFFHICFDLFHF